MDINLCNGNVLIFKNFISQQHSKDVENILYQQSTLIRLVFYDSNFIIIKTAQHLFTGHGHRCHLDIIGILWPSVFHFTLQLH